MREIQHPELPPETSTFQVVVDDSVSLEELKHKTEYTSVMRSAHVGNQYDSNITLFNEGLPAVLYDRTVVPSNGPGTDRNYRPETIIQASTCQSLIDSETSPTIMTTHLELDGIPKELDDRVRQCAGKYASELHLNSLHNAFPQTPVKTHSQYMQQNNDTTSEMLKVLSKDEEFMGNTSRRVTETGVVERLPEDQDPSRLVQQHGWFGVESAQKSGIVIPNEFTVLQYGVIEALNTGSTDVYHLAGPDMIKYAPKLQEKLNRFYDTVRNESSFGVHLPPELRFHVVPTAHFKFAVPEHKHEKLDALIDICTTIGNYRQKLTSVKDPNEKHHMKSELETVNQKRDEVLYDLDEIFSDVKDKQRLSHYDTKTLGGHGIYLHPSMKNMTVREVEQLHKELHKRYKKLKDRQ